MKNEHIIRIEKGLGTLEQALLLYVDEKMTDKCGIEWSLNILSKDVHSLDLANLLETMETQWEGVFYSDHPGKGGPLRRHIQEIQDINQRVINLEDTFSVRETHRVLESILFLLENIESNYAEPIKNGVYREACLALIDEITVSSPESRAEYDAPIHVPEKDFSADIAQFQAKEAFVSAEEDTVPVKVTQPPVVPILDHSFEEHPDNKLEEHFLKIDSRLEKFFATISSRLKAMFTQIGSAPKKIVDGTLAWGINRSPLDIHNLAKAVQEYLEDRSTPQQEIPNCFKFPIHSQNLSEKEKYESPLRDEICKLIREKRYHLRYQPRIIFVADNNVEKDYFISAKLECVIEPSPNIASIRPVLVMVKYLDPDLTELCIPLGRGRSRSGIYYLGREGVENSGEVGAVLPDGKNNKTVPIPYNYNGVSRCQARIFWENGYWYLQDGWGGGGDGSASRNGTYLNGKALKNTEKKSLSDGCLIGFGPRCRSDEGTPGSWEYRSSDTNTAALGCTFVFLE